MLSKKIQILVSAIAVLVFVTCPVLFAKSSSEKSAKPKPQPKAVEKSRAPSVKAESPKAAAPAQRKQIKERAVRKPAPQPKVIREPQRRQRQSNSFKNLRSKPQLRAREKTNHFRPRIETENSRRDVVTSERQQPKIETRLNSRPVERKVINPRIIRTVETKSYRSPSVERKSISKTRSIFDTKKYQPRVFSYKDKYRSKGSAADKSSRISPKVIERSRKTIEPIRKLETRSTKKDIISHGSPLKGSKLDGIRQAGSRRMQLDRGSFGRDISSRGDYSREKVENKYTNINIEKNVTINNYGYPYLSRRQIRRHRPASYYRPVRPTFTRIGDRHSWYDGYYRTHHSRYHHSSWRRKWTWDGHGWNYIWLRPSVGTVVYYKHHNYGYGMSYIYPRYHRRYMFVSIGGYWPAAYRYRRYYWYGCHPYRWYGSSPTVYVINEQNHYYQTDSGQQSYGQVQPTYSYDSSGNIVPDYDAFAKVREKMVLEGNELDEPQEKTLADEYFEQAVEKFESNDYEASLGHIQQAIKLSPDDVVLPFVYGQILFAAGDYSHAAAVVRMALNNLPEDNKSVFFPRGLYTDDGVLNRQIQKLADATELEVLNSDLQLLLGYQLLGIGELDQAEQVLIEAKDVSSNVEAADVLLDLVEQARLDASSAKL